MAAGVAGYVATRDGAERAVAATPPPAMPVPVTDVVKKTIPIYLEYSARTESIRNVSLQAKIAGYVHDQPVEDGADVEKDALTSSASIVRYGVALDRCGKSARPSPRRRRPRPADRAHSRRSWPGARRS